MPISSIPCGMRKAVGAVVVCDGYLLLVRKVLLSQALPGPLPIPPEWGIPKGGVQEGDASPEAALMRELAEETGSDAYRILRRLPRPLVQHFDRYPYTALPYDGQETVVYLVEYLGNPGGLAPQDDEVDRVLFVPPVRARALLGDSEQGTYVRRLYREGVLPCPPSTQGQKGDAYKNPTGRD